MIWYHSTDYITDDHLSFRIFWKLHQQMSIPFVTVSKFLRLIFRWIESTPRLWLLFVWSRLWFQTLFGVVVRSIQEDSFVTSRIRCFHFSSGFPHYFLSFPAGQICFCRPSGLLHSLQPLSRAVLPTYSSSFGFNSGRVSFFIALYLLDRFSNISFLKVALHGTRAPQLLVFF